MDGQSIKPAVVYPVQGPIVIGGRYLFEKVLGKGSYGTATLLTSIQDKSNVVMKTIDLVGMKTGEAELARQEAKVLLGFNHPNIVSCLETYEEDGRIHIIMEYCSRGKYFTGVLLPTDGKAGVVYIKMGIPAMDLKTANIFVNTDGLLKLGDFGVAKVLKATHYLARTGVGTPYYMSPEICQDRPYSFKTDIWSLGCVLYEMMMQQHPFQASGLRSLISKIVRGVYPPMNELYSKELRELCASLLRLAPTQRPNINEVLRKPLVMARIQHLLSASLRHQEFSHTTLHNSPVKRTTRSSRDQVQAAAMPLPSVLRQSNRADAGARRTRAGIPGGRGSDHPGSQIGSEGDRRVSQLEEAGLKIPSARPVPSVPRKQQPCGAKEVPRERPSAGLLPQPREPASAWAPDAKPPAPCKSTHVATGPLPFDYAARHLSFPFLLPGAEKRISPFRLYMPLQVQDPTLPVKDQELAQESHDGQAGKVQSDMYAAREAYNVAIQPKEAQSAPDVQGPLTHGSKCEGQLQQAQLELTEDQSGDGMGRGMRACGTGEERLRQREAIAREGLVVIEEMRRREHAAFILHKEELRAAEEHRKSEGLYKMRAEEAARASREKEQASKAANAVEKQKKKQEAREEEKQKREFQRSLSLDMIRRDKQQWFRKSQGSAGSGALVNSDSPVNRLSFEAALPLMPGPAEPDPAPNSRKEPHSHPLDTMQTTFTFPTPTVGTLELDSGVDASPTAIWMGNAKREDSHPAGVGLSEFNVEEAQPSRDSTPDVPGGQDDAQGISEEGLPSSDMEEMSTRVGTSPRGILNSVEDGTLLGPRKGETVGLAPSLNNPEPAPSYNNAEGRDCSEFNGTSCKALPDFVKALSDGVERSVVSLGNEEVTLVGSLQDRIQALRSLLMERLGMEVFNRVYGMLEAVSPDTDSEGSVALRIMELLRPVDVALVEGIHLLILWEEVAQDRPQLWLPPC
eukprot:jgi/Botrbrau1/18572/Bobra.0367s0016.1